MSPRDVFPYLMGGAILTVVPVLLLIFRGALVCWWKGEHVESGRDKHESRRVCARCGAVVGAIPPADRSIVLAAMEEAERKMGDEGESGT